MQTLYIEDLKIQTNKIKNSCEKKKNVELTLTY